MSQIARPIADVLVGGTWSPASSVWASIDTDDTSEFATATGGAGPPQERITVSLTSLLTPLTSIATLQFVTRATGNQIGKPSNWALADTSSSVSTTNSITLSGSWLTTTVALNLTGVDWTTLRFSETFNFFTGTIDLAAVTLTAANILAGGGSWSKPARSTSSVIWAYPPSAFSDISWSFDTCDATTWSKRSC